MTRHEPVGVEVLLVALDAVGNLSVDGIQVEHQRLVVAEGAQEVPLERAARARRDVATDVVLDDVGRLELGRGREPHDEPVLEDQRVGDGVDAELLDQLLERLAGLL